MNYGKFVSLSVLAVSLSAGIASAATTPQDASSLFQMTEVTTVGQVANKDAHGSCAAGACGGKMSEKKDEKKAKDADKHCSADKHKKGEATCSADKKGKHAESSCSADKKHD